ncbi:MAG: hydrogenase maturation nickel metallochaperone HypA [Roseiarcus sp.]
MAQGRSDGRSAKRVGSLKRRVMHEMSVAHGLLSILQDQAKAHGIARISRVRVKLGRLRGIDGRQLRLAFEALAEGGLADGAALDVEEIAAKARCRACGAVWRAPDYRFECPDCAAADSEILEGRELFIESFDGERPESA